MKRGLELVLPLLEGKIPDRVPICCNMLEQGARELNLPIPEYYTKGEYVAEGQLRLQKKFGNDVVWGFMYTAKAMEIIGSRHTVFSESGPPNVGDLVIKDPSDIRNLIIPEDIYNHERFAEWRICLEILARECAGQIPILSIVLSSFSFPAIMMGIEGWLRQLFFGDPGITTEILEKAHLLTVRLTDALRKSGAQLISYVNPVGTREVISPDQFRELCLPWVEQDFAAIGTDGMVYFNGGGPIGDQIEVLREKCGLTAFYLHPDDDIRAAKETLGGQGIIAGCINDMKLISHWSKDDIRAEVKRIMTAGSPGGGFIFGTLVMPYLIPEENIRIMMDAAREFGTYGDAG